MRTITSTALWAVLLLICMGLAQVNSSGLVRKIFGSTSDTDSDGEPKFAGKVRRNKMSKMMHYVNYKARESLLASKSGEIAKNSVLEIRFDGLTDRQVIEQLCDRNPTRWCHAVLHTALRLNNKNQSKIVKLLRRLPPDVEADRVLYVALLGLTVKKLHTAQVDKGLNLAWNLVAKHNLYIYGATKAIDVKVFLDDHSTCVKCKLRRDEECIRKYLCKT